MFRKYLDIDIDICYTMILLWDNSGLDEIADADSLGTFEMGKKRH